ncbi:penicillin-binding protein 2 [Tichowtungia aerotolerans]|uniref:Penicillin-binding protein 2 n=1 Tax=Tichowtungia aerotolerans TaxID=2697043 RepID=A0A6P1MEH7_9BACT|nr:penicillin-binding protein 2 [Tichowtungia aerotolerans]QHI70448.1 penicillin-binding protein 2 [Tichowtungia aerotolerans]
MRIYVALACMAAAYLFLMGSLWRLQVADSSRFEDRIQVQSLRRIRMPGIRGKIYDRNDLCLADNRPDYSIAMYLENIRRPGPWAKTIDHSMEVIDQVSAMTGLPPKVDRDDVRKHIHLRLPLPLILWRDIGMQPMARFAEQALNIPGVDLYTQMTRQYPYSPYTSHLIGYVGKADPGKLNEEEKYNYYLPEMGGRAGLEKLFDPFLRGEAGGKIVQIDVSGYHHDELARREPRRGGDLRLTLDIEVQLLAHQALGTNQGAVVVMDPNNGDVLAMVSAPSYDANLFVPYITSKDWRRLSDDPAKPLLNRAVAGTYPPGSTFKPFVGLAASTVNPHAVSTVYDCPGAFRVGRRVMRDWNWAGHGERDLRGALMRSANVYFFKTILENGWEPVVEQADKAGFGQKTGVEVDYEAAGLLPDKEWQRKTNHGAWTDGDSCNLSIGQGFLAVTPIQMAMMTATIANGGTLYKPRLIQAYRPPEDDSFTDAPIRKEGRMDWSQTALTAVRGGMHDVIMAKDGTGKQAAVEGLDFAGKTGTAEYWVMVNGKRKTKKHTWMIAFAPFDNPQYAVAFLIENGASGGRTVGPRLKILLSGLFEKLKSEGRVQS